MKRLYENIENIHIKGSIHQLSEVVGTMDRSLQSIADDTQQLTGYLVKYSASNKGAQYEKVVQTSLRLREAMFAASQELHDMQNQIVRYQNKVYRYEDMHERASKPVPYTVTKKQVVVDKTITQFTRSDMMVLSAALKEYSERVYHHIRRIEEKKNAIASVWMDVQYRDFAEFIDIVKHDMIEAIRVYRDYVRYLDEKIKELS